MATPEVRLRRLQRRISLSPSPGPQEPVDAVDVEMEDSGCESEVSADEIPPAVPLGEVLKASKGRYRMEHYSSFRYDGVDYDLEDTVLVTADGVKRKPFVCIIKHITLSSDDTVKLGVQWLYRPEEVKLPDGCSLESVDARELYCSFHFDKISAETVMHKCVVHFLPNKAELPDQMKFPGFVVRRFYDRRTNMFLALNDERLKGMDVYGFLESTRKRFQLLTQLELDQSKQNKPDDLPSAKF